MAKEIREIIAFHEQQAAKSGDQKAQGILASLRASVDFAENEKALHSRMPAQNESGLPSQEQKILEPLRFSQEAREALLRDYRIYTLTGQSIKTLKEEGRQFWSTWHNDYPDFEALSSRLSEVAIPKDPKKLFLPKSNNKPLSQQEEMITKFSEELGGEVSGVRAIIGEASDYTELAFAHLDATRKEGNKDYLFGEKYGYNYARTKTPTVGSFVARIGGFDARNGLFVGSWGRGRGHVYVFAAPLVVPAETRK